MKDWEKGKMKKILMIWM